MLVLVAILALTFLVLAALLWVGTTWIQGYVYEGVVEDLYWRAPAAALVISLFVAFWCFLDYRAPGSVPGLFQFRFYESNSDEPFREFWAEEGDKETHYTLRKTVIGARQKLEYRSEKEGVWPPSTPPDALIVKENDERVRFEAQPRDPDEPDEPTRYVDPRGRVIRGDSPAWYSLFRWSLLLKNFFLYTGLLVVWFLAAWLLLQFQWSHALGLAVICWLVTVMLLMPPLLEQVEKRASTPAQARTAPAAWQRAPFPADKPSLTAWQKRSRPASPAAGSH